MTIRSFVRRAGVPAVLCLVLVAVSLPAAAFSTLEERMSAAQFKAAGLDKLSAEELAALNAWLQGNHAAMPAGMAAPAAAGDDRIGFRAEQVTGTVTSRYVGEFTGWSGKTVFTLENGQVWQQIEQGNLRGISLQSPMITIEQGLFGSWKISVEGLNATTRVKRIK